MNRLAFVALTLAGLACPREPSALQYDQDLYPRIVSISRREKGLGRSCSTLRGLDAGAVDDRTIHLRCRDDQLNPQTASANRILVEADFKVSAIVPHRRTFEDVYQDTLVSATVGERLAA